MYSVGPGFLCLDCMFKVQQIEEINLRRREALERQIDYASDEMDSVFGIGQTGPRFRDQPRRPAPNIYKLSQPVFHNIQISNSVVGAVNTGTAHVIDVSISTIRDQGQPDTADAIQKLTQAIVSSHALQKDDKDEALDAINVIAAEAQKPADQRQRGLGRILLKSLDVITSKAADAVQIWPVVHPVLQALFQ